MLSILQIEDVCAKKDTHPLEDKNKESLAFEDQCEENTRVHRPNKETRFSGEIESKIIFRLFKLILNVSIILIVLDYSYYPGTYPITPSYLRLNKELDLANLTNVLFLPNSNSYGNFRNKNYISARCCVDHNIR